MSRVVLSIGSNLGDRLARLQSAVDGIGDAVRAVSPVYETDAWGGVEQSPFLNVVVIADDPALDPQAWLRKAQAIESDNQRVRELKWGPRTLDIDLVWAAGPDGELICGDADLTLPHPFAHERAFVLMPWLDIDPLAELTVDGRRRTARELLDALDQAERDGVRPTVLSLTVGRD